VCRPRRVTLDGQKYRSTTLHMAPKAVYADDHAGNYADKYADVMEANANGRDAQHTST